MGGGGGERGGTCRAGGGSRGYACKLTPAHDTGFINQLLFVEYICAIVVLSVFSISLVSGSTSFNDQ